MTKAELAQAVYERVGGFSRREAGEIVDALFATMRETLGQGEHVKISGFGKLTLRDKHERPGRNPQTGAVITIDERRVLAFKTSPGLKERLNPRAAEEVEAAELDRWAGGRERRG
jgi:integration host factor subunit alpha